MSRISDCEKVDEVIADVIDGTASNDVIDHLVTCDRCRDARHDAMQARGVVTRAGDDYVSSSDLVDRLMKAVDARVTESAIPVAIVTPSVPSAKNQAESQVERRASSAPLPFRRPTMASSAESSARWSKRRTVASVVSLGVVVLAAAAVAIVVGRTSLTQPVDEFQGSITSMTRASRDSTGVGLEVCDVRSKCRPAKSGEALRAGDRVRTDARTRVHLELTDGSEMAVDRDSELELVAGSVRTARLHHGVVAADVSHVEGSQATMLLPHTTVKVIGTTFILTATDDTSLVEVTHGEVALLDGAGNPISSVRAGREGRVMAGRAPVVSPSMGAERGEQDWISADGRVVPGQDDDVPLRGIGELRAKKPGESNEREFMKDGKRVVRLAQHHVKVRIAGSVARTEIDETFANDSPEVLEGIYRMSLPPDAQIERLALEVDGMMQEGSFVARDRAAAIWKGVIHNAAPEAKAEPDIVWVPGPWRDPALLEWQRGGHFELKIFPIPAKGSRRVVLAYTQKLDLHGSVRRYTYPLTYDPKGSTVIDDFDIDVRVLGHTPAFGVKTRGYAVSRGKGDDGADRVAMSARAFVPAGDLTVEYALAADDTEMTTWTYAPPNADAATEGYVALAIRPKLPSVSESRDRVYGIVVDTSRSMYGERWTRTGNVVSGLVRDLDRRDRFFVLACDTECRSLTDGLQSPSPSSVEDVRRRLTAIEPEGAHDPVLAIRGGLQRGAGGKKLDIVYVGDGNATAGTSKPDRIAKLLANDVSAHEASITTIGIGGDADPYVLGALARAGGGTFVRDAGQGAVVLASVAMARTRGARLEHPSIRLPAGLHAIAPESLDTLPEGGEMLVIARTSPGVDLLHGVIELDGSVGGEKFHQSFPLDAPMSSAAGNGFVPRLYAAMRIADLERTKGDASKDEIIRLSRDNNVASRFTSLLVLESEAMFKAFGVERNTKTGGWTGEQLDETTSADGHVAHLARKYKMMALAPDGLDDSMSSSAKVAQNGLQLAEVVAPPPVSNRPLAMMPPPPCSPSLCDPPYEIDAAGRKRYKVQCLDSDPCRPDSRPVARSDSPYDSYVPARRVWTRHGAFVPRSDVPSDAAKIVDAEAAHTREPDHRTKTSALVRAYAGAGRVDDASNQLRDWLGRDPIDTEALLLRADLAGRMGDRPMELRILASIVDLHPDDVGAQLRVASALEQLGDAPRACSHRIAIAESSPKDLDNLGRTIRCARATGLTALADDLFTAVPNDQKKRVETPSMRNDALRGDVQLDASWDGDADLDISLVDAAGRRFSWTGVPVGSVSIRNATSGAHETVAFAGLPVGTYTVEITNAGNSANTSTPLRGTVDIRAIDQRGRATFVTSRPRTVIGVLTLTATQSFVPIE